MLNSAISTFPRGLGLHARSISPPSLIFVPRTTVTPRLSVATRCSSVSASRPSVQPRFIQHKKEAYWFYRFLSIVYDHIINPGHWTEDMRDDALKQADQSHLDMRVVDVGGGTGFTTLGIIKTIVEGDAEDLPFPTDFADRYVSAGRSVAKACLIGPVQPTFWLSRFFADVWMLFPKEEEYIEWFKNAGFKDVQHGLIIGCSVTGVKPASGGSQDVEKPVNNPFSFLGRFLLGTLAAAWFVLVPIYMWIKDQIVPKDQPI
ncbi:hypothetical protein Bca52824_080161 [Brassica carinata]|uniref:MPBQ/MBSQ family SAM-binding methyltransferase profile domain-containing protein n=1 Tax=Brassica carinata TaxID=52824 RepID=A0A8X7U000_BRACI|nr:hypothetical protein Bca52824_080161 [Brassica carinata]